METFGRYIDRQRDEFIAALKAFAPNENIRLDDYFQAMRLLGRFIANFGEK